MFIGSLLIFPRAARSVNLKEHESPDLRSGRFQSIIRTDEQTAALASCYKR
ncbi:hypothetical protein B4092_2587 [Bacillus licheniformis]|nr:hypothetical protein B4092_2587 [Bacillus licheniformis]